ncbi:hypothetical protein BV898_16501 [Hypsibius exemplaris]|uniref:C2H2-type domain-containing protein n=1 Tax=Hypsibius exemplaris TaxID=2072580 RepID=A0A9X6NG00_HYPEX|nr:hypothetical protein BV898_16501 [Hypsibius exemplaris]
MQAGSTIADLGRPEEAPLSVRKSFSCNICQKQFRLASTLSRHRDVHSERRRFVCGDCGRGFRQSAGLRVHQRKTHGALATSKFPEVLSRTGTTDQPALNGPEQPEKELQQTTVYTVRTKLSRSVRDPATGLKSVRVFSQTGRECLHAVCSGSPRQKRTWLYTCGPDRPREAPVNRSTEL